MSRKGARWTAEQFASDRNSGSTTLAGLSMIVGAAAIFLTRGEFIPPMVGWPIVVVGFAVALTAILLPMLRRSRTSRFRPSKINTAYARTSTDFAEPQHPWLRKGQHSHVWLIGAPGTDVQQLESATQDLDRTLVDVIAPSKPSWYVRLEKTGYLILVVPGVIAAAICVLAGVPIIGTVMATLMAAVWLGYPLAGALQTLARSQARQVATTIAQPTLQATSSIVRPVQPANVQAISSALQQGVDPTTVQDLGFRAAGTDADADRAADELVNRVDSRARS